MTEGTVVLTGATGLLGSEVLKLLETDHRVHIVGRSEPRLHSPNVSFQHADFSSLVNLELPASTTTVIHLAQSRHFRRFPEMSTDILNVNLLGTARLLDAAVRAGARQFVLASSGVVYGSSGGPFKETAPPADPPVSFYAATKRGAELLLGAYRDMMISSVSLRFFFIYGSGQSQEMLIPRLVDSVRKERAIPLQGENGLLLNPIHVSDAARALMASLELEDHATINVAGAETLSLRSICEMLGVALHTRPLFEVDIETGGSAFLADISKMWKLLCSPRMKFEQTLPELIGH